MSDTKERILLTALRRFARDGCEAVSVSDIAGELDMTKAALYKHYRNKRDIFGSILARMERRDAEQAQVHGLPEGTADETADAYRSASLDDIVAFGRTMFRYWTEDEFSASFRRMLSLEQYRDPEMGALYRQYLVTGPVGYLRDLFAAMGLPRPERSALAFYAPMFLLYSVYDGAENKAAVTADLDEALEAVRSDLKKEKERTRT